MIMSTIQENLNTLATIKSDIKTAITNKGVEAGDDITEYGNKIRQIESGGTVGVTDYLCFEALEDSSITLINNNGNAPSIEYSTDKQNWTTWDYSSISVLTNNKVYMRGINLNGVSGQQDSSHMWSYFVITGNIKISGYLSSLYDYTKDIVSINSDVVGCFEALFIRDTCHISDASELKLDNFSSLGDSRTFINLFRKNTNLIYGPKKFSNIVTVPQCYQTFFAGCTNLISGPSELPAVTLSDSCYLAMFQLCSSLVNAPYLPAVNLVNRCYENMFNDCHYIQYIKADFTTTPSGTYTGSWVSGVASTGCFIQSKDATWTTKGIYACPSGWTLIKSIS